VCQVVIYAGTIEVSGKLGSVEPEDLPFRARDEEEEGT
jgi:hypothetical protein